MSTVRIRLVFGQKLQSLGRKCWFLVDSSICHVVADLEYMIRKRFDIARNLNLFLDGYLLPAQENIVVLRDGDLIRVKEHGGENELTSQAEESTVDSSRKKRKLIDSDQMGEMGKSNKATKRNSKQIRTGKKQVKNTETKIPVQQRNGSKRVNGVKKKSEREIVKANSSFSSNKNAARCHKGESSSTSTMTSSSTSSSSDESNSGRQKVTTKRNNQTDSTPESDTSTSLSTDSSSNRKRPKSASKQTRQGKRITCSSAKPNEQSDSTPESDTSTSTASESPNKATAAKHAIEPKYNGKRIATGESASANKNIGNKQVDKVLSSLVSAFQKGYEKGYRKEKKKGANKETFSASKVHNTVTSSEELTSSLSSSSSSDSISSKEEQHTNPPEAKRSTKPIGPSASSERTQASKALPSLVSALEKGSKGYGKEKRKGAKKEALSASKGDNGVTSSEKLMSSLSSSSSSNSSSISSKEEQPTNPPKAKRSTNPIGPSPSSEGTHLSTKAGGNATKGGTSKPHPITYDQTLRVVDPHNSSASSHIRFESDDEDDAKIGCQGGPLESIISNDLSVSEPCPRGDSSSVTASGHVSGAGIVSRSYMGRGRDERGRQAGPGGVGRGRGCALLNVARGPPSVVEDRFRSQHLNNKNHIEKEASLGNESEEALVSGTQTGGCAVPKLDRGTPSGRKNKWTNKSQILMNKSHSSQTKVAGLVNESQEVNGSEAQTGGEAHPEVVVPARDFTKYPPLCGTPRTGDRIAYKVVELSASYTPEMSNYKEGVVLDYDPTSNQVLLELTEASLEKPLGDGNVSRKFELIDGEEEEDEDATTAPATVDKKVSVLWATMIEPRLIM